MHRLGFEIVELRICSMNWVVGHFQRYRERQPWDFCWRISLEGYLVSFLLAVVLLSLGTPEREFEMSFSELAFLAVFIAPVFETLLLQALPIWLARICGASFSNQIICSVVPFFLLHLAEGLTAGLCAGLTTGYYLAFTYAHWRNAGRWTAFWTTAVSHCIHNAISTALMATAEW